MEAIAGFIVFNDPNWNVTTSGDYNGYSQSDILLRSVVTGGNQVYLMNGAIVGVSSSLDPVVVPDWSIIDPQ